MTGSEVLGSVIVLLLFLAAAILAIAETGLTRMRRARAEVLSEHGVRGAATLVKLLKPRDRVLNPVLLLVLACHLISATIVGAMVAARFGNGWLPLAAAIQIVVFFVFAEAAPKTWALRDTDRAATAVAPLVRALLEIRPLRWITSALIAVSNRIVPGGRDGTVGPVISDDELVAFASEAVEADAIEPAEHALIESIIEFGDTILREVMVPRPDMVMVDDGRSIDDTIETTLRHGYSRLPVYGAGVDDIVGIAHLKDLLRAGRDERGDEPVTAVMVPPRFVPETKKADELLREMQAGRFHLAVVIDEYGGTSGIVTLEDLIEELIGEIVDEFDTEEPLHEAMPGGDVRVHGRMPVYELNDLVSSDLPDGDWDTVGGLIFNTLGHVPAIGEGLEVAGVMLRVEQLEGRRITRVRVHVLAPEPGSDADADEDNLSERAR